MSNQPMERMRFRHIAHRPISNFITATLIKDIEESYFVDSIEMAQIMSDKRLLGKLRAGHKDAKAGKGNMLLFML